MKDNEAPTPFIDNLCLNRGIEKSVMVSKILANAEALKLATAPIVGQYQKIVSTKQVIGLKSKKDLTKYQEIIDNQEFARSEIGRLRDEARDFIRANEVI